jgi:hypothetical protein
MPNSIDIATKKETPLTDNETLDDGRPTVNVLRL